MSNNKKDLLSITSKMINKTKKIIYEEHTNIHNTKQRLMYITTKSKLQEDVDNLRQKRIDILDSLKNNNQKQQDKEQEIELITKELEQKLTLNNFVNKIKPSAAHKLLSSDEFIQKALSLDIIETFIISMDIRRSTDLMLKAKNPKLFAKFLVELSTNLKEIILNNYGIYDKFTGDGVLAYFPEFFSGEDAGYYAIKSANECHKEFEKVYKKHYSSFLNILDDTGFGIGIDYGTIYIDHINDEHVVVGTPVVYACRLATTKAGTTLLNQQAIEKINNKYKGYIQTTETTIDIKHEGRILAYKATFSDKQYNAKIPYWEDI